MADSVYEQLGGFKAVKGIVSNFYKKVLVSKQVNVFFAGIDIEKQIEHQTKFIASLIGGPVSYSHDQLKEAHKHLKIGHDHFDEILKLLCETMEESGISEEHRAALAKEFEARRAVIVTL